MSVATPNTTDLISDGRAPGSIVQTDHRSANISVADLDPLPAVTFSPVDGTGIPTRVTLTVPGHSDATIYYSTVGAPTFKSRIFTTAIVVDRTTRITAVAFKTGYAPSPQAFADYLEQNQLAAPTFNPPAGSAGPTSVTISGPAGASIYYTTDGSTPTPASALYSAAVGIGGDESVKAIAVRSGWKTSVIASAYYVYGKLPDVVFSPASGSSPLSVALSTPGYPLATIYYSVANRGCQLDPQDPYQVYSSAVTISDPANLYAYAILSGYADSNHSWAQYSEQLPAVEFGTVTGGVLTPNAVTMSVTGFADADIAIYYTDDGTTPTSASTRYDAGAPPFFPTGDIVVKAFAVKFGFVDGPVASFNLVDEIILPTPVFTPSSGSLPGDSDTLEISVDGWPTASIYYTTNGLYPNWTDTLYTGPIDTGTLPVTGGVLVQAIALVDGIPSPIGSATFAQSTLAAPTLSPSSGTAPVVVTITTNEPFGQTRYTLDGTEPSDSTFWGNIPSPLYTTPLAIASQTTVKAKTFQSSYISSATVTGLYAQEPVEVDMHSSLYEGAAYQNTFGLYTVLESTGTYAPIGSLDPFGNTSLRAMALDPTTNTTFGITDTKETPITLAGTDGIIVHVGYGKMTVSYDGKDWTQLTNLPITPTVGAYGDSKFMAIDADGTVATSTDLTSWNAISSLAPATTAVAELKWFDSLGMWIALSIESASGVSHSSPDGVAWTRAELPNNAAPYGLAEGNGVVVTMAAGIPTGPTPGPGRSSYTLDGLSWTSGTITSGNYSVLDTAYCAAAGKFVAVGLGRVTGAAYNVMSSSNGTNWAASGTGIGYEDTHLFGVASNGSTFLAFGGVYASGFVGTPTSAVWESSDGVSWTSIYNAGSIAVYGGAWNGSVWAVPTNSATLLSNDAVPTSLTPSPGTPARSYNVFAVVHGTGIPGSTFELPTRFSDQPDAPTPSITGHYEGITVTDGTLSAEIIRSGTGWEISSLDHDATGEFSGSLSGDGGDVIPGVYTDQYGATTNISLRLPVITRKLVTIDAASGALSDVASIDVEITAATIDSSGQMYAAGFETPGVPALYTVDKSTGAAVRIGNVVGSTIGESYSAVEGLSFNSSGSLYGVMERTADAKSVVREIPVTASSGSVVTRINVSERFATSLFTKSGAAAIGDASDVWNHVATHNAFGTIALSDALGNPTSVAYYTEDNGTGAAAWSAAYGPTADNMMATRKQVSAAGTELASTIVGLGEGTFDLYWYGGDSPTRQPQKVTLSVVDSSGTVTPYGQKTADTSLSGTLWTENTHYVKFEGVVLDGVDDAVRMVTGAGSLSNFAGFQVQSTGSVMNDSSILDVIMPNVDLVSDAYARDLTFADGNFFLLNSGAAVEQIDEDLNGTFDPISNTFDLRTGARKPGVASVTFSPVDGATVPTTVTLATTTAGASIYYTLDGSDPLTSGTAALYSAPLSVTLATTIRAYATYNSRNSNATQAGYVAIAGQVSAVTFSPNDGEPIPGGGLVVEMSTATSGASIYYSTDPGDVADPSTLYTAPVVITENTSFRAMATKTAMTDSVKSAATYGVLGSDEVEFFYLDKDSDYVGPWFVFTPNGGLDFHFAIYFNLAVSTTVNRMFITIQTQHSDITAATNASPIVISTDGAHGLSTGDWVHVYNCTGNDAANGEFQITRLSATAYELQGSAGNGAYTGGGEAVSGGAHTSTTTASGQQAWDTLRSAWYPLGVFDSVGTQLNSAYGTTFGPFTGLTRLDVYGQIVALPGSNFTLWVVLSDGRTLVKTVGF